MTRSLKTVFMALAFAAVLPACSTVEPAEPETEAVVTRRVVKECEPKTCPDCSPWKERAMNAEERAARLEQQLQSCLRK